MNKSMALSGWGGGGVECCRSTGRMCGHHHHHLNEPMSCPKGGDSAGPRTPTTPTPPPPLGAFGQHLVAKDVVLRHPWAPKVPHEHHWCPMKILSNLHPNTILKPNLDTCRGPALNVLLSLHLTVIKTEYWDRAGGGGNISYDL